MGNSFAQITIQSADMPAPGDQYVLSTADTAFDISQLPTDTNYTWDFSHLRPRGQRIDSFLALSDVNSIYQAFFFGQANLVHPTADFDSLENLFPSARFKDFIDNSSSSYKIVGLGVDIDDNHIPVSYDSADFVYRFPLNYGDADSSVSTYDVEFGSYYYGQWRKRINEVDGWGQLHTPLDTYNVLRVKTVIYQEDTFYSDSTGGTRFVRTPEIQYKWLAPSKGVPMVQINGLLLNNDTVMTELEYRDTLCRPAANFTHQDSFLKIDFSEAARWEESYFWEFGDGSFSFDSGPVHRYDTTGRYEVCLTVNNNCGSDTYCDSITVTADNATAAPYYYRPEGGQLSPNPLQYTTTLTLDKSRLAGDAPLNLEIYDVKGRQIPVSSQQVQVQEQSNSVQLTLTFSSLENGLYLIKVLQDKQPVAINKMVIQHP